MLALAAAFAGVGVALGAFGAHALRARLEDGGRLETWETAVTYQLVHGVALFALAIWTRLDPAWRHTRHARAIGILWSAGIVCFSGSLYAICLGVPTRLLWPVTPLGGMCFLAGWTVLTIVAWRGRRPTDDSR